MSRSEDQQKKSEKIPQKKERHYEEFSRTPREKREIHKKIDETVEITSRDGDGGDIPPPKNRYR